MNIDKSKLPNSFGVQYDSNHPRWSECINIMNDMFNDVYHGNGYEYYGVDTDGEYNGWDTRSHFDTIITVDEFFQIIDSPTEITNYQIY